jgi:hypothetical protein
MGMLDPVWNLFEDRLLSGSEGRLSSPSSGANHDPAKECLAASSLEGRCPLMKSLGATPTTDTLRAAASALPRLDPPSHKPPP